MTLKRKHDPGYKLPEVIDPDTCCICIPVPNDFNHKMAFLGQLDELGYWWNWERDPLKQGREAATVWRKIVSCVREDLNMSDCGCGDDKPTNSRINPETGLYEVSFDGGITWEPAPQDDPRSSGTIFPPVAGDPGDELRCTAANSALGYLQEVQAAEYDGLVNNATIADFILLLTGFLGAIGIFFAFIPAAIAAMLAFVVNFFGHQIAADFLAAFTEAKWDELFCILFCHMEDDGSFTVAGWQAVKDDLDNDVADYALGWMYNHINLIGQVGLTNAARASYAGTRECDECDCDNNCAEKYQIYNEDVFYGTILEYGTNFIIVETGGTGFMTLEAINPSDCCYVNSIEFLSGTGAGSAFRVCGDETAPPWTAATPIGQCANIIEVQFTTGYPGGQVKIFLDECP